MSSLRHKKMARSRHEHRLEVSNDDDDQHHHDPSPKTDVELETPTNSQQHGTFFSSVKATSGTKPRKGLLGRSNYRETITDEQTGGRRMLSATSSALTRFKGMTIRAGSNGRVLNPRPVALVTNLPSPRKQSGGDNQTSPRSAPLILPSADDSREDNRECSPERNSSASETDGPTTPPAGRTNGGVTRAENKLSVIFDDGGESDDDARTKESSSIATSNNQENAPSPRSKWVSTLMASTLARERATGRKTIRGQVDLLPRPQDAQNKVDYLIKLCKAAQTYASTQAPKISKVRDGQHIINQLRDVASDLDRQHDKILAVYDAREVRRLADRLGSTLKGVYDLLGDIEATAVMFGKKKAFGKRVTALVQDIGMHANALLAATSLAIADRPNVLYMADAGTRESQQAELVKMCIEGDKHFFGRGKKQSLRKAFEAYFWAAERGCPEAMYMSAWMYSTGIHVETDTETCQLWLERAVDKGYAPAMNDLAVMLLCEADRREDVHPELKADPKPAKRPRKSSKFDEGELRNIDRVEDCSRNRKVEKGTDGVKVEEERAVVAEDEREEEDENGGMAQSAEEASLPPEQGRLFEQIMEMRKRAMRLFQKAAKTGHTDAMTNLGNMQEAMGYFEDARNWYSLAADPSESANNPRAQNYLGMLFYEGRGVTRDLAEAVKWFRRGARQSNAQACQNLGICYQAGLGVAKDIPKAVILFRQAVERGSISATNNLAYALARDALHTLATAARHAPANMHGTGLQFEDPSRGALKAGELSSDASSQVWREMTAQLREAADLFRRAADSGIADASYQLGRLYQQGLGIPLDPVAAFENFLAAAEGSVVHPAAAACVGDMLYTGTGCLQDYGEALRYYLRAAHAGESTSANAVGLMHELGRGAVRDLAAAAEWYARAADLGSADGAFNAGLLHERGDPLSTIASAAGLQALLLQQQSTSSCWSSPHFPPRPSTLPARTEEDTTTAPPAAAAAGNHNNASASPKPKVDEYETVRQPHHCNKQRASRSNYQTLGADPSLALHMFERAAELGHPGAVREVERLRLRDRMSQLVGCGAQQSLLGGQISSVPGGRGVYCSPGGGGGRSGRA